MIGFTRVSTLPAMLFLMLPLASPTTQLPLDLSGGAAAGRAETRHLAVTTSVTPAGRAGRITLRLDVIPKPKMHVYAPGQADVIPVTLQIDPLPGVRLTKTVLPKAESFFFAPLSETQLVYSRPFALTHDIIMSGPATAATPLVIKGTLRYQACDDAICYVPQSVGVSWTVAQTP